MTYPTEQESKVIQACEELMIETMKKYDPSHDALHGKFHSQKNASHEL